MKKILSLIAVAVIFNSCQQDIQTNTPAFQAKLNDVQWRANDARVSIDGDGGMTITAYTPYETVVLKSNASDPGTYILGTNDYAGNHASYTNDIDGFEDFYNTTTVEGPAFKLSGMITGGTGYTSVPGAQTIGGSGVGLRVATQTASGAVTKVTIVARGEGYVAGDVVTVVGGDENASFRIINIQQSNGEIEIEEVENGLFTGTYKFNAVNENGEVITFSEGVFYKIPLSTF
ncbi:DUF6252 family protein [Flavobacterium sp.]|uniref:DUF6252 family protein n=1 Tax=Flavobacterium sp. TaxID=239 RepID=UPI0026386A5A|nr:DUF6252 family protein [Flavobacterium sp.]MDD3005888.1 DUF6252 family protein [Flavobacterium sp.]